MNFSVRKVFQVANQSSMASLALLILRIIAGSAFIIHGWGKIQSPLSWMPADSGVPGFLQLLAAVSEFGGGIAWILGLVTPLASLGMAITMAVATMLHAIVLRDPFVSAQGGGSYELAFIYFAISLVLVFAGPGKFALDFKIFGNRS